MNQLLIELFSEEIPALMQLQAVENYKKIFSQMLKQYNITIDASVYITARRITIFCSNVPNSIKIDDRIRGPKTSSSKEIIENFCITHKINIKDLEITTDEKYYLYTKKDIIDIREILLKTIPQAITSYVWPKNMKWGDHELYWIRPLKNILCILNNKILPIQLAHLTGNNITFGHRSAKNKKIVVENYLDYKKKLKKSYVMIDHNDRLQNIKEQLLKASESLNLSLLEDENLLHEVTGLTEFPVVMTGKIPKKFLILPEEVLIHTMRRHQKYFCCINKKNQIAPYFFFVSNAIYSSQTIIKGNEKVLTARLTDALHFYQQDLLENSTSRLEKLNQITFHTNLGSIKSKANRISKICAYLLPNNQNVITAANLCKTDLTTYMVKEFPELQGIMGGYYTKKEKFNSTISSAIKEHYKPLGSQDSTPSTIEGSILSIADKLDTMIGLMHSGIKPSGSKDPYALRRYALSVIRIILKQNFRIKIKEIISIAYKLYCSHMDTEKLNLIIKFFEERTKNFFKKEFDIKLINSVVNFNINDDLVSLNKKLIDLQQFLFIPKGQEVLTLYKRINNIIKNSDQEKVQNQYFQSKYESNLFAVILKISKKIDINIKNEKFIKALNNLFAISKPLNKLFDNLTIKDTNHSIAKNRIALLNMLKNTFNKTVDFSAL